MKDQTRPGYRGDHTTVTQIPRCRALRRESTKAERALWHSLRDRQLAGIKFRRQHQFGPFILDFYCPQLRLAIELDGDSHALPAAELKDEARTRYLEERGMRVLRFENLQVLEETGAVLDAIWNIVNKLQADSIADGAVSPSGRGNRTLTLTLSQSERESTETTLPRGNSSPSTQHSALRTGPRGAERSKRTAGAAGR